MGKVKNGNSLPFRVYIQHNYLVFSLFYQIITIGNSLGFEKA